MSRVKIIYGTAGGWGSLPMETCQAYLDILRRYKVKDIDTAYRYAGSEKALGELGAPSSFVIHSKTPGFSDGALKRDSILAAAKETSQRLSVKNIETYFLHSPDPITPIEETVEAMQEVYAAGGYKHVSHLRDDDADVISLLAANTYNKFGLSNFKGDDVKKIYDFAKSRGYVLPTVYQGNYNPVGRHYDTTLFPLLRELQIAFYAYSPLAGGFLVKDPETFRSGGGQGRWDPNGRVGAIYRHQYNKSTLVEALSEWDSIANDAGVSKAALAYRWVMYNSMIKPEFGDGIIIGASRPQQLEQTLRDIEYGPLEAGIAKRIDAVWDLVKDQAPIDNYHSYAIEAGLVS